jgi:hypothetical protein
MGEEQQLRSAPNEPYSTQIGLPVKIEPPTLRKAPLGGTNVNPAGRFHDDDLFFVNPELAEKEFPKFVCADTDFARNARKIGIIPRNGCFKKYIETA